jgi:[protein-PII] uridylyltransferase
LHQITGRKCDRLHLEYQKTLAHALEFQKLNGREPVEGFLGALHGRMAFLKQQHLLFLYELKITEKIKPWKKSIRKTKVNGLEVKKGMIFYSSSEELIKSPDLLIKIFEESARLKIPLSTEARRLVKEFGYLVNEDFRNSKPIIDSFERILTTFSPTFNVLNEMLSTGFLERFIPEFNGIVNRIQYNEYHLYPVDLHLLRTVRTIKNFGTPEDVTEDSLYGKLYKELKSPKLLLWAALLHDIGKADSAEGHSKRGAETVRAILTKRGFRHKDIETIAFLVEAHLLLVKTATRRDINDEETSIFCARTIKDTERLKMLYLLSVADSIATGPMAWSEWTAVLVRDLFLKIFHILEKGELATHKAVKTVEKKKAQVLSSTSTPYEQQAISALFSVMSPRYLLYTPAPDILKHVELYNSLKNDEIVWQVAKTSDSNIRNVTVCAQDSPGLFSKIAGVFTLNNIDILDAQIYTWQNNVALDIFKVKPPPDPLFEDERWSRAKKHLKSAINDKLDLGVSIKERIEDRRSNKTHMGQKPDQIVVDNDTSDFFTIIEVFTNDFPGLLFKVTNALYRCGLDIRIAKIATNVDQVVDIFYVRDLDGQKVDSSDQVSAIKSAITEILPTS